METMLWELETAVKSLKLGAPGSVVIHNTLIKHLPLFFKRLLLKSYDIIWTANTYSDNWRDAILIPGAKPVKNLTVSSCYRPITMTITLD